MYNFYPKNLGHERSRYCLKKILLIMKLTTLMLIAVILHVSATSMAQKVTLVERNAPLVDVFQRIRTQTGYDFLFTGSDLKNSKPVTINVKDEELTNVLDKIFREQPLNFSIENNSVVIQEKKEPSLFEKLKNVLQASDISGRVLDSLGQPLIGASVWLKDTKYNTLTDNNGHFRLPSVPEGKYALIVTYIGYARLDRSIEIPGKTQNLVLFLHPSTSSLDQVQVIAYGTESKRFSIGSVSTITADVIEKQPVTNPLLALEGQAPGLAITATNGVPGSTVLVQVRGQSSLGASSLGYKPYDQPLFIIDGVPSATQNANINQLEDLATAQSYSGGINQPTGISPFNNINPNDIESITILKDAAATSIYGSQGANGVILITTKKGKAGKTTVDIGLNSQFNEVARPVQLLNTQQYLQLRKAAYAVDGLTPSSDPNDPNYAPDLTIYDQNKYTNWQKVIQGNSTHNTDLHASVSGGSANNTFIVSGGYTRSDYNYPGDFADQRYTLHSALTSTSANKRFTMQLVNDYGYDQNNSAGFGGSKDVVMVPNAPSLTDAEGNLIWSYKGVPIYTNFYSSLKQPSNLSSFNFNSDLNLNYLIFNGLTIGANLGYSRLNGSEHSIDPLSSQAPSPYGNTITAYFANNTAQTINVEPQINYTKTLGKGVLNALVGGTYKKNTSSSTQSLGSGYANDNILGSIDGAANVNTTDGSDVYRYSAAFARLKYLYDQKYIIELSGRRDGSSNFGPGRQFGNFGSVGAGWIFSEEKVFKDALPFFSYGKLSGSYGTTGGDASKAYQYQELYQSLGVPAFQGTKQSYPVNLYNPDFSWATKKSLNLAVDLGFFNNRLLMNATYYRDREGDQLVNYPLPIQAGLSSVYGNLNALVQNKGWEFSLSSTNIKSKNFTWRSNFNISFNRNKLLSFPDLASSPYADQYIVGQPTSVLYGYKYKGVNPTTGLFEYYDKNGNATSTPAYGTAAEGGDEVVIDNRETNYMGGLGNTFSYKNFSLYVFCQFSSSNQPNSLYALYSNSNLGMQGNQPVYILGKYWTAPGDQASIQRLTSSYNASGDALQSEAIFTRSSGALSNDTYLRVKTVSLSYSLPDVWLKKVNIKSASLFLNAQNLFTITNYKFGDPEQPGSFTSFPLQRIIAFGTNFQF